MFDRRRFGKLVGGGLALFAIDAVGAIGAIDAIGAPARHAFGRTPRPPVQPRPRKPTIWNGRLEAGPGRGIVATRYGTETRYGRLRTRLAPRELALLSQSNDNQTFLLWVIVPKQKLDDWQFLEFEGVYYQASSGGGDDRGSIPTFTFDRATAQRLARALAIPLRERAKLDGGLRYRWSFPPTVSVSSKEPIPAILHVENAGTTTVGFMVGGRQRGPRDNRFSYTIARNGTPVPIKVAHDFGGIGGYRPLEPGDKLDVTCADLRAWADFDLPGHYAIEAVYEGELSKDGVMPQAAADRANIWDIRAVGQGAIIVK